MEVVIVPAADDGAALVADAVVRLLRQRPAAVLGLATGSSPLGVYRELIARCARGEAPSPRPAPSSWTSTSGWPRTIRRATAG